MRTLCISPRPVTDQARRSRQHRVCLAVGRLLGAISIAMVLGCTPAPSPGLQPPPQGALEHDSINVGLALERAINQSGPQLWKQAGRRSKIRWQIYSVPASWTRDNLAAHYTQQATAAGYEPVEIPSGLTLPGPTYQQMFASRKAPAWPFIVMWSPANPGHDAAYMVVASLDPSDR